MRSPFGLRSGLSRWHELMGGVSIYAINGLDPSLVLDFSKEFYRTGGSTTTFDAAMTHTRSGNATMVDSQGFLKWAPHNLLTYSEQFDNGAWAKSGVTIDPNVAATTAPDGTNTADKLIEDVSVGGHLAFASDIWPLTVSATVSVYLKAAGRGFALVSRQTADAISVDLTTGDATSALGSPSNITSVDAGNGWWKVSFTSSGATSTTDNFNIYVSTDGVWANRSYTGDGTSGIYIWGAHLYRSDLGGMVDNPDTGNSYVPTTSAARYLPRRGHHIYNGAEWVNEGVLVESEQRVNLVTYSNDFTQWTNQGSADAVASGVVSPDGTENTTEIVETATTGGHSAFFVQVVASANWTASCYIKQKTSGRYAQLRPYGLGVGVAWATFDPSDGTLYESGGANLVTTTSEPAGNGWYRVSFTCSSALLAGDGIQIFLTDGTTGEGPEYTGDGTSGIYVFGAQLEAGSTPSSYIPTSGSTATRSADTITVPSANLPYSATAMSIQMDGKMTYADEGTNVSNSFIRWRSSVGTNLIRLGLDTSSTRTGQVIFQQYYNGVVDAPTGAPLDSYSPGINVPYNIASRHGSTFINGAVDGTALTVNPTPTALPDLSSTNLNLAFDYMGTVKTLRMWNQDLGDAGIALASDTIVAVPAGAIQQRDGAYILDRSGNYIEVRA
jgi:hypothetical protein